MAKRSKNRKYNPNDPRPIEHVGDARKKGPLAIRLRHSYITREMGGAEGHRGAGWAVVRKEILKRDRNRSTTTGYDKVQGHGLQVDHIQPYRLGGRNRRINLRTVDVMNNWASDLATGAVEKPKLRNGRW